MTDKAPSKPRFAPVWPYLNEVPNGLQIFIRPSRVSAFNRGLTAEELKPLTEDFTTPCGTAFRAVAYVYMVLGFLSLALWTVVFVLDASFSRAEISAENKAWITEHLIDGFTGLRDMGTGLLLIMIPFLVVLFVIHFIAWKKWRAAVASIWEHAGGRLVRTKNLPGRRREVINRLGGDLDTALRRLDPTDAEHSRRASEAVAALGRYIDLPEPAKGAQAVAESPWQDEAVQKVRAAYEAGQAAEQQALTAAKDAVNDVETLAREVKEAAAEQKIVGLAQRILDRSAS